MLFLIVQIFILLLLAALLGASLGHWWTRRRYEDVTELHEELIASRSGRIAQPATKEEFTSRIAELRGDMVTSAQAMKEEVRASIAEVQARLKSGIGDVQSEVRTSFGAIRIPETNLQPVEQRIAQVEQAIGAIRIPEPDFMPVNERLTGVEQRLASVTDMLSRLDGVEQAVRNWKAPDVDLGPVHSGIVTLQLGLDRLKADLSHDRVHDQITRLENGLIALGETLDAAHKQDIDALAMRVSAIRLPEIAPHVAPLESKLSALERTIASIRIPEPDLTPIQVALAQVGRDLRLLDKPPVDLDPLARRFTGLEAGLGMLQTEAQARRALEAVERRLAGLEEALAGRPEPDMEGVKTAIYSMDSRQDIVAVENRITAIEYSLAALHHMLRTRPESRVEWRRETTAPAEVWGNRPSRDSDPINTVRRSDDQANLLTEPAFGPADDLKLIHGVGPMLAGLLNEIGVFYFWQMAEWTPEEIGWVDGQLMHFRGRIKRDDWVGHARQLAQTPTAAKRPTRGGL